MEDWTKREEYRNPCNIWEQSIVLEEIEAQGKRHKQLMEGIANNLKQYEKDIRKQVCDEIKDKLKLKEKFHPEDDFEIDYDFYYKEDVEEVLDQIQEDRQ